MCGVTSFDAEFDLHWHPRTARLAARCAPDAKLESAGESRWFRANGGFSMTDKRIVFTTAGSENEARKIAHHLVEHHLAACANIIPRIQSIYRWQGKMESNEEWLLLIKTSAEKFGAVRDAIRQLHSYDLPECIAVNIDDGSAEYLQWLAESLKVAPGK
jgi:periplasmic divalent cation tolerance protein